jgi:hypothetical protein
MGFATAKNIKITQFYSGNKKLGLTPLVGATQSKADYGTTVSIFKRVYDRLHRRELVRLPHQAGDPSHVCEEHRKKMTTSTGM